MGEAHHAHQQWPQPFAAEALVFIFSLHEPVGNSVTPIGLGCGRRLGNELFSVALVDACLTISIDLALVVVVDTRAWRHAIICGVVCASELAVELKLRRGMLPFLPSSCDLVSITLRKGVRIFSFYDAL